MLLRKAPHFTGRPELGDLLASAAPARSLERYAAGEPVATYPDVRAVLREAQQRRGLT